MSQVEEINLFLGEWAKAEQKVIDQIDKAIDKTVQDTKKKIIQDTPVGDPSLWNWPAKPGYTPGTLKASWKSEKEGSGLIVTHFIYNNVVYAERVEYGSWSTQAPQGMMRLNLISFPNELEKNIKANLSGNSK